MAITLPHDFGDIVYLKTDPEQLERMIAAAIITPGVTIWEITCGTQVGRHYEFEFSTQKDIQKQLNIQEK